MTQENVLRMLIVEESLNDAEMLISVMRNAGHPVRATRAEDDEDVEKALDEEKFDLFICNTELEAYPVSKAKEQIVASGKDLPLLALAEAEDPAKRNQMLEAGAVDMVYKSDLENFRLVTEREFANIKTRRRLRQVEKSLKETEKRCRSLLDSSRDAIAYIHEGMHIYANKSYLEKFGVTEFDDIEGMPILDMIAPSHQPEFKDFLRNLAKHHDTAEDSMQVSMMCKDVETDCSIDFCPASIEGEACTQIVIREKHFMNEELEKQLENLSRQDLLTGLWNRQYFMEHLDRLIQVSTEGDTPCNHGVLFILLDNYRSIKETLGIASSDIFISDIANVIKDEISDEDIVARFGDSSFIYLHHGQKKQETLDLAERIRKSIEDHISEISGQAATSTCSIGAVILTEEALNGPEYVSYADQACSVARNAGGNQVHLFVPTSNDPEATGDGRNWKEMITEALEQDRFFLVFQPIASLLGDTQERYEVRVRMEGDDGEIYKPADFMPTAERSNLMLKIDQYVIRKSLEVLAEHRRKGHDTIFFIKLSQHVLNEEIMPEFIKEHLVQQQLDGIHTVFQIAEPMIVTHLNQARNFYTELKEMNCLFAIDHFGSGLNPFQLVKHVPADYLKIDESITGELADNEETQERVRMIMENAKTNDKKVIATHVEDAMTLANLWQYHIDFVQGYFLQGPEKDLSHDFSGQIM